MKHPITLASTALAVPLLVLALSTPLFAETPCDATLMHGSIAQLSATHATVETSAFINAATTELWAALTDFGTMATWSTDTLQGMTGPDFGSSRTCVGLRPWSH
jgi:hypothetical protein